MSAYKTILLAVNLSKEGHIVAERAMSVAQTNGSTIHIVHAIEPLNFSYNDNILLDLTNIQHDIEDVAKIHLKQFSADYSIPETNQHLVIGNAKNEIQALAERLEVDLIVIGSHGRSGFSLLLGSTANGVLHGSKCDVLAVRVGVIEQ